MKYINLTTGPGGGAGRYTVPPCTTKRRTTTHLKTKNNQNCQKIKLYESPTTKELKKKHFSRLVGEVQTGSWGGEDAWQGSRWQTSWSYMHVRMNEEKQLGSKQTMQPSIPVWGNKASKPLAVKTCGVQQREKLPASLESLLEEPTGSQNIHEPTYLEIRTEKAQLPCGKRGK